MGGTLSLFLKARSIILAQNADGKQTNKKNTPTPHMKENYSLLSGSKYKCPA